MTCEFVINAALRDGLIPPPGGMNSSCCPDGYHSVFLAVDEGNDYHWYRKDDNTIKNKHGKKVNTWSHKPGGTAVTDKDASGNIITDPAAANKDYRNSGVDVNYKNCGYLCAPNRGRLKWAR